jgi:sarcosine oxidase subunit beta
MRDTFDAIVIGAGVLGAGTTLELARRGRRVLCLDKLPAAGYGSTGNSCAIVRTHYSTLDGTALAWESTLRWKSWGAYLGAEDERGLARLIEAGLVVIRTRDHTYERHLGFHETLAIPFETWSAEELGERVPFFDTTAYAPPRLPGDERFGEPADHALLGAVYFPRAGYVNDPQLAAHNLQRAAESAGAAFRFNTAVTGILRETARPVGSGPASRSERVSGVTLGDGTTVRAPVVVNAAGPHSFVINRMAGIEGEMALTTRALRREVHYLPFPTGAHPEGYARVATDDDVGVYCREEAGGMMLVGSLDPACDAPEWVDDPDVFDREVTPERWRAQVYRAALRIPDLAIPSRPKGVADLYDVTEDWIPIYDRSGLDGFYLAVGTSGNQFKNAPMVGELMAELIAACEAGHDHDRDPVRIRGPATGAVLDLGFYSRNRAVNPDSSGTVLG